MSAIQGHASILGAYDKDANAIFARMAIPPAIDYRNGINSAVVSLKQAGIWQILDCFALPVKAGTQQQGLLDWIRPESLTFNGSQTWAHADGLVGASGAGDYAGTGYRLSTEAVHYTAADSSQFVYTKYRASYPALGRIWGTGTLDADETSFFESTGGAYEGYQRGVHYYTAASKVSDGLLIVNQVSGTINLYQNGTDLPLTVSGAAGSLVARDLRLSEANAEKIMCWGAGGSLTGTQRGQLKSIIDTYVAMIA